MGLDYVDLYLIHNPISLRYIPIEERYPVFFHFNEETKEFFEEPVPIKETWQAMEALVDEGLCKNIGISNFNCALIRDMLSYARIKPATNQVELHPYNTQETLIKFCHTQGITVTAYSSFGAQSFEQMGFVKEGQYVLKDPVFLAIAEAVGKTPGQVALRWAVQRGTMVLPKSENEGRIAQNLDIFNFSLSDEQMATINGLNRNLRFVDLANFGIFCPMFE